MMINGSTGSFLLGAAGEPLERRGPESLELSALDRRTRSRCQSQDEPQIMQAQQPQPENLPLVTR